MRNSPCPSPNRTHGTKHENLAPRPLKMVLSSELLARLRDLVRRDRGLTAELLAHLGEVEARRLHLEAACPSMFKYCTDILGMSGAQSYKRIGAARLARRFPRVLSMVKSGAVHLSTLCLLTPHLTDDSAGELLQAASGKSKREVEQLLAARFPNPAVPDRVRKLPRRVRRQGDGEADHKAGATPSRPAHGAESRPVATAPALPFAPPQTSGPRPAPAAEQADVSEPAQPAPVLTHPQRPSCVVPLSAEQYKVELTASARLVDKIRTAQELLRHQLPDGDLATVLERALDALLPALRKQRFAEVARPREARLAGDAGVKSSTKKRSFPPRPDSGAARVTIQDRPRPTAQGRHRGERSRHIPATVKRQVAKRDGHQCTFTDGTGRRCPERGMLEFHHVVPFGKGGRNDADNITLRCRGHNQLASVQEYGARVSDFSKTRPRKADVELSPGGVPSRAPRAITSADPWR